jgi:hypothetical protein
LTKNAKKGKIFFMKPLFLKLTLTASVFFLFSCVTSGPQVTPEVALYTPAAPADIPPLLTPAPELPSITVAGRGVKNADALVDFFLAKNPGFGDIRYLEALADTYIKEAKIEGINSDVAWVQMCLETGFLKYGNLVTPEMNNFCGLGAIDAAHPGERFPTVAVGVRAHVQHLQAYATTHPLRQDAVDPRYRFVQPRGKAPDILSLSGTWAADPQYGRKIMQLLEQLAVF